MIIKVLLILAIFSMKNVAQISNPKLDILSVILIIILVISLCGCQAAARNLGISFKIGVLETNGFLEGLPIKVIASYQD